MIKVQTFVSDTVLQTLSEKQEIIADNRGSGFDRQGLVGMYQILRNASGFSSFFFGIEIGTTEEDHADDICVMSSNGNIHKLTLEIPKDEVYRMNYYSYCDLLYFTEFWENEEDKEYIQNLINQIETGYIKENDVVQVIYPILKKEYVVKIEKNKKQA